MTTQLKPPKNVTLGDSVWLAPVTKGEWDIPRAVKVLQVAGSQLKVVDNEHQECWVDSALVLRTLHPTSVHHVDDMIGLGELREYTILHNLHLRYKKNIIYTYIGMMLVAINPYKELGLYGPAETKRYRGKNLRSQSPHIYAIGNQSYDNMRQLGTRQCIVISGESGSGKTESTKLLMEFLTALSGQNSNVEQQLILANPVLEGFGNARTVRNDNSSRFGKYTVISYNEEGQIVGACIEPYLLERSRVTNLTPGNRNYHVFYSLLAGLSRQQREQLWLQPASAYKCLTAGGSVDCEGRDEVSEFSEICRGLKVLNFSEEEIWEIFKLLAVILHLCNVKFEPSENLDSVSVKTYEEINRVQKLLQVDKDILLSTLTKKAIQVERETVVSDVSETQAVATRDAFARALYYRLFIYIVNKINKAVFKHEGSSCHSIGILDIFGFEDFDNNSFEQLCINYANEQLQQFFVKHIFKLEQEEYKQEQIVWTYIPFDDNNQILSLIGGDRVNIFSTTDDLSRLPSGTDTSLVMKCNKNHEKNPFYVKPKSDISQMFGIRHYAGTVTYSIEGFLEKNRNTLSKDWLGLLQGSSNSLLKTLFAKDLAKTQLAPGKAQTVMTQYRASLEALMSALNQCQPFFIRCIKPNDFKQPNMFDQSFCCRQLRHSGLMDTARIRSLGYPIRLSFADFVYRYRILVPGRTAAYLKLDAKGEAERICRVALGNTANYQLGKTKVFLQQLESSRLELERERVLDTSVVTIQKHVRAWLASRRYKRLKQAALTMQKYWRGRKPRRQFLITRLGYLRLQAKIRSRHLAFSFSQLRKRITLLQSHCRGYLVRKTQETLKPVGEKKEGDMDQWITSIFDAAVEGSEDIPGSPEKPLESPQFKAEEPIYDRDRIPLLLPELNTGDKEDEQLFFTHFAAANFTGNITYQFSKKPLKHPLLDLPLPADQVAALALWVTILRFMGDLPEPQTAYNTTNSSIMTLLTNTLSHNVVNSQEYAVALNLLKKDNTPKEKSNLLNLTLVHKNKLKKEITRGKLEGNALKTSYSQWLEHTRSNVLQKLHFIIGHGILRTELRDEIYCQICKQLSQNPSHVSEARGWALMALCVGCFAPSPRLAPYLRSFLARGPSSYDTFTQVRLLRTIQNGTRQQPPSWHELNAIRNQQKMVLAVSVGNGQTKYLEADSATTAQEVCARLCEHLGIDDTFGFSLFVTVFGEMIRLEAGKFYVMDAISQCEQDAKERGLAERDTPWHLLFRKEMFAPWQGLSVPDPVATNLIYHQVIGGIQSGEYRCTQDSELALIAAQQYYVDHGMNLVSLSLRKRLPDYIPARQVKQYGVEHWENLVSNAFKQSYFVRDRVPEGIVKADVVNFAKTKWPLLFSKYYEVLQITGPDVGAVNMIVAVNSTGICLVTNTERVLLHLSYIEIHSITLLHHQGEKQFQLLTVQGYEFIFQSRNADVVVELVQWIIHSLKEISKYFIAVRDYTPPGGGGLLGMKKGDLIALEEGERGGEWLTGSNVLTGDWGEFPATNVRVLPAILQPPLHIIGYFNKDGALDGTLRAKNIQKIISENQNKHTLEQYAKKCFRLPLGSEVLWSHSTQPLALPLNKTLQNHQHKDTAVTAFMGVLKYMGDLPTNKYADLTDLIYQGPMENEILRDELYCQLMKQLTNNKNLNSEEKGWELMCLAAGLFYPSSDILKELRLFLSSREHPLAYDSLQRLEQTLNHGNRKFTPHWTEVQAMQQKVPITHTITFPNNTEQRFEVNSTTRICDLVQQIGDRFNFQSVEGFCLVATMGDKTIALASEEFLFDAIQEICALVANDASFKKSPSQRFLYELMFLRKVWLTMVPGKDRIADVICHYPQELPKYILGYQKCSKTDAATLGALIFRASNGQNKIELLDDYKKLIPKLVPSYHLKIQSHKEWKKAIAECYKRQSGMTAEDAKINYLNHVFNWSTFGSSFFDIKQTTLPKLPEQLTVAINKNGIFILDFSTKEPLMLYPYSELTCWSSTSSAFTLVVDSVRLVCATTLGYKMDDLISSYTALLAPRNKICA